MSKNDNKYLYKTFAMSYDINKGEMIGYRWYGGVSVIYFEVPTFVVKGRFCIKKNI